MAVNPHIVYRRAATAAQALLLAASLGGAALLVAWFAAPGTVDAVDAALRQRHLESHQRRLEAAEIAEENGEHGVAVSHLEETRRALRPVLKGDRLDPLKRQTLERLARAYRAAADEEAAIGVVDEWSAFDPRDLRPLTLRASWQGTDGIGTLLELRARFQGAMVLSSAETQLAEALLDEGREVDALTLAADMLGEAPDRRWQVLWDDGNGFRAEASVRVAASVDDTGALSFDVAVPGTAQRLRIDAPESAALLALDLSLRLEGPGPAVTVPLSAATPRAQVRNVGERTLEMAGPDPRIVVSVPTSLRGTGQQLRVGIRGRVLRAPHSRLIAFLASPGAAETIDLLERRGDSERARRLRLARGWFRAADSTPIQGAATGSPEDPRQLAVTLLDEGRTAEALALAADSFAEPPDGGWQVFWDEGDGFRETTSRTVTATTDDAGALSFEVSVPRNAQRLRIDAPASALLAFDLLARLEGSGAPVTIPLSAVPLRRQVRNVGERTLEMAGPDPRVVIEVPASLQSGELRVAVSGWVMPAPHPRLIEFLASPGATGAIDALERRGDGERARRLRRAREWLNATAPAPEDTGAPR